MSPLEFVKPSEDVHMNVLLYGHPKTGKSMGAGSAPGPVLYLNADSPARLRVVHATYGDKIKEARVENLGSLADAVHATLDGGFKTVVLDPIGDVHRRVLEAMSSRAIRPARDFYGDTTVHLERFCRHMCELPVNFVICAHDFAVTDEATGNVEWLPWTGTSNTALGGKLMAMVDIVGYTGVRREDPLEEGGDPVFRYMSQLIDGGGRRGGDGFNCLGPAADTDLSAWERIISENLKSRGQAPAATSEPAQPAEEAAAA